MTVPASCPLCSSGQESHSHLFFTCPFSTAVWSHYVGWMSSAPPASLASVLTIIGRSHIVSCLGAATVVKLLMQSIVYMLWRERNHRIFRQSSSSVAAVINAVESLPPPRDGSVSYLQLYLSSRSLFPP
ncbi:uncharacterized protein LOC111203781 [Brassica napus]|nr:uncharacterized protein LOC111203781 [Brassica napus]